MSTTTSSFFKNVQEDFDQIKHPTLAKWHNKSKFFFDIPAILLMLVLICMGIGFGCLAFYEIQRTTHRTIQQALNRSAKARAIQFSSDINLFTHNMDTMATMAKLFHTSFNLSSSQTLTDPFGPLEYATLVNGSHLLVNGIISLSWHPRVVPGLMREEFVARMRNFAAVDDNFKDYEIYGYSNGTSNEVVVRSDNDTSVQKYGMFPTAFLFPYADGVTSMMGFDPSSGSVRGEIMLNSYLNDGIVTITPNLAPIGDQPFFQVYKPVFTAPYYEGQPKIETLLGFVRGVLVMEELVKTTEWYDTSSLYVVVYDSVLLSYSADRVTMDPDDQEERKAFVYSNIADYGDIRGKIKKSKFKTVQTVMIVDRNWTLIYAPKESFLTVGDDSRRNQFIGLFVILICFIVMSLCVAGAIVVKHFVVRNYVQMAFRERVDALQENNCKLENLLDRIAIEEHRTRGVMNSVPFAVLVVDKNGKFLEFNKLFRTVFGQGSKGLSKMSFNQIFPNYKDPEMLYDTFVNEVNQSQSTIQMIPMELTSKFSNKIPSEISVTKSQAMVGSRDDHLYIIIIKASSEAMKQATTASNAFSPSSPLSGVTFVDNSDLLFHRTIQDGESRAKFKEYCTQMHNDESILFIEAVIEYRETKNTVERIEKQEYIYETFLRRKAKKELNLPGNLVQSEQSKLKNGLGQPDVFDTVYNAVCTLLQQDAFRSFQMSRMNSTIRASVVDTTAEQAKPNEQAGEGTVQEIEMTEQ